jgi:uncharacterized GH25 family protein
MAKKLLAAILVIVTAISVAARFGHRPQPAARGASSGVQVAAGVSHGHRAASIDTATIDGRVIDDANAPVTGVKVCVLVPSATCAISDTNGAFAIASLALADARKVELVAQRAHYVVASQHRAETSTALHAEVLVTMTPGGALLTGFVRDAGGGPVAHAFVVSGTSIAEAADDGQYALWMDPATTTRVTASADGYAIDQHEAHPPGRLDFALVAESTMSGKVIDAASGRAIPHVSVTAANDSTTSVAETDDDGRFRIAKLSPAMYDLNVDDAHSVAVHAGRVPLGLGEHVDGIVVRVVPAFEISGRIAIDPSGQPCTSDPSIAVTPEHGSWKSSSADNTGTVRAGGLTPGRYRIDVSCGHHLANAHYDDIVVTDHDVVDQRWHVTAGAMVTGRVVNAHGAPVADATVYAEEVLTSHAAPWSGDNTKTEADGSFKLAGLRPGRHQLTVVPRYGATTQPEQAVVEVSTDLDAHHDFVVDDSAAEVTGHVVLADGTPARNIGVTLTAGDWSFGATTDETGRFSMSSLPSGELRANIRSLDTCLPLAGADDKGLPVHLAPGTTNDIVLTTTAAIGEIRGRVVDDHGEPVGDAFVRIEAYTPSSSDFSASNEVMVGTDGSFRAGQLADVSYRVRAYRKSGGEASVGPVSLGANVTLTLAPTASIAGTVRLGGAPMQRFFVWLETLPANSEVQSLDAFTLDGHFALHGVVAGHYRLSVTSGEGGKSVDFDVGAGEDKTLDLDLDRVAHVRGRIVERDTGRPLPYIEVSATQSYSDPAFTDDSGQFDLAVAIRGPLEVNVLAATDLLHNNWIAIGPATKNISVDADSIDLGEIPIALPE